MFITIFMYRKIILSTLRDDKKGKIVKEDCDGLFGSLVFLNSRFLCMRFE